MTTNYKSPSSSFGLLIKLTLIFWILENILTVSSYNPGDGLLGIPQQYDNMVDWEYGEPAVSENQDIVSALKRTWKFPKRRFGKGYKGKGSRKCGDTKVCEGKCCGRFDPICCKRGWTCRYTPRTRSFVCIP